MTGAGAAPAAPAPTDMDAYTAYWYVFVPCETRVTPTRMFHRAAYGYDVNSPEFKEWQASQMAQYKQYYASQGYAAPGSDAAGAGASAAAPAPPPSEPAPPPPPA
jgi:hypothetical protein